MPKILPIDLSERLIATVKKRECLYNTSMPSYKSRNVAECAWKEVANEMRRDVHFCKTRWASLRCTFNRNIVKIKKNGPEDCQLPKWHYFQQMLFLKNHVSHGKFMEDSKLDELDTDNNYSISSPNSPASSISIIPDDETESQLIGSDVEAFANGAATGYTDPYTETERKYSTSPEDPVQQAMLHYLSSKSQNSEDHEDMVSLRGLLPFFKKLPPEKKMKFMHYATGYMMELYKSESK